MGPLKGLKIVEMSGLGPCPLAGQLLADLGAQVTIVDRASASELAGGVNRRGKRSIILNLKSEEGIEIALKLVGASDALIEGYRPGVMERLGLGPEPCLQTNPALVYGRMTGWGQDGPNAQMAGHDINYLSITGALHAMGEADRPPIPPLNLVADYGGGGMFLVMGVLAALYESGRSGKGQIVDAAMVDGVPAMMGLLHTMLSANAWTNERHANLLDGAAPFYRCYETADKKFISVGALEPQFFAELCDRLELDAEWKSRQYDRSRWPDLADELRDRFSSKSREEWAKVFSGSDACVAPVLDFDEAADHKPNVDRSVFFESGGITQAAPAPRFSRTIPDRPQPASEAGAEGRQILGELGYSDAEISGLKKDAVVS